jgi:hypothetical protein
MFMTAVLRGAVDRMVGIVSRRRIATVLRR